MIKKAKKVLVTGGSGYIGSVLIDTLSKKGFSIRILDIVPPQNISRLAKNNIEFVLGDVQSVSGKVFRDVSAVIHLAGVSSEFSANRNPKKTWDVNTIAAADLAKKAKKAKVTRFIFASSASIYDHVGEKDDGPHDEKANVVPSGHYSISKHQAESQLLKLADRDFCITILRKGTVYGYSPTMRWDLVVNAMVKNALEKGIIRILAGGLQWRPLVSIDDVIDAYTLLLTAPKKLISGHIFNIALDNFLVKDVAVIVEDTLKNTFNIHSSIVFDEPDKTSRSYRMSTKKAKRMLGFKAKVSVERAVETIVRKEFKILYRETGQRVRNAQKE